jgi:hypothetical protein
MDRREEANGIMLKETQDLDESMRKRAHLQEQLDLLDEERRTLMRQRNKWQENQLGFQDRHDKASN